MCMMIDGAFQAVVKRAVSAARPRRNSRLILSSIRADSCYVRTESTPDSDFIDGVVVVVWRSSPPRHAPFTTIDLPLAEHDIIGRLSPPDICPPYLTLGWLGSRVVSVLDSGA